ncbi:MAG: hypothetical protein J6S89_02700 [Paludibacteraceae bacterium]|nr:hypothetical protein [Paludibacteraceae bacterium]
MSKFALIKIDAIKGKQEFVKLMVDGMCPFDDFENSLETMYSSELVGIYCYMQDVANLKTVPKEKFHFYDKNKKYEDGVREFEFKSKHLRVYGITMPNGKIIITGGTKAKQTSDQNEFRRLKKLYLSSIMNNQKTKTI